MTVTKHAIERFQERVTEAPADFIKDFVRKELAKSEFLYSIGTTEKRTAGGITYVIDCKDSSNRKVVTLYLNY